MKKTIKIKAVYYTLTLCFAILFSGCEKTFDINKDPDNPSLEQGTPALIFPAAVASTAGAIGGEYAILGGIWSQYWAQSAVSSQFRTIDSYNISQSDFNPRFNEVYAGALNDYQYTIKKSEELGNWKFFLMGTVMKAYTYQVMVDLYDTLPYTEAFMGINNLKPKFDDGYSIYQGLLSEINNALSKNYNSSPSVGKSDIIFQSNMDKWVQFANTLKLKLYLRMVYAKPAEAEAGIKALYASGVTFLDTDASMAIFEDLADKSNPLYEYNFRKLNTNGNLRASRTFLTFLQANNDPRVASYYSFSTGTSYRGLNQGDQNNPDQTLTNVSIIKMTSKDPVQFISLPESYFLQAEALERFFGGVGAKEKYDDGVSAAFAQYGYDATSFTQIGGVYEYPILGNFEQKLEKIIVQKWASFPGSHALEGFFEHNRTGYPKVSTVYSTDVDNYIPGRFVYSKTGTTGGLFPKRLIIPEDERNTNPNTPSVTPITTKVWWDKK